ncbi:MAG: DNA-3-methyladenine glycosylase 2 family protein, partial [Lachnospiraceae bacterium]|nr:DNA-3-methyladenine glycosylase 2 family protein [Lachnospiraceae bacterium]
QKEWDEIWDPYFDLDTNYRKIRKSIPSDDVFLKNCAKSGAGIRILRQDKFEMLISFIISQRKSIPAIRTSVERLVGLYGKDGFFPEPEAMLSATEDELASCGLGYRCSYVYNAARRVALGEFDLEEIDNLPDDELFDALKSFAGVGDKVANCVALFAYHRCGRAPIDTWIARIINEHYDGVNPFNRYGTVAGIMQQYMFYSAIK